MIYGQQYHPKPQPREETTIWTREKLLLMLANPAMVDVVKLTIDKHKLPYVLTIDADGKPVLTSTLNAGELWLEKFITVDEDTLRMLEDAKKMTSTQYEVLITGPTGTGKELIAKSMIGARKGQIKVVNCAGLPENLIESELFGHMKGAFTGADKEKKGMFEEAQDGVMFLDEIGELDIAMQGKLLRALQEKRIRRVGGNSEIDINCKFVCATNKNLREMVARGEFKEDLFARISTLELHIKGLVHRMCDCVPIVERLHNGKAFLDKHEPLLVQGALDLSFNVRSLQQHVIRYNVLGRVSVK